MVGGWGARRRGQKKGDGWGRKKGAGSRKVSGLWSFETG